jgi:molecular chaperone DnaK
VYDHVPSPAGAQSPYVLVYDLGGGTFDVSVLEIKGDIKEVLASSGDTVLGGDDFDELLKDHLLKELREQAGREALKEDIALKVRLLDIAERAKIGLSDRPYVKVNEVAVATAGGRPLSLDMELSREFFQSLTAELIERTMTKVAEVLREANLEADDIGKLILVGGATRMPAVHQALSELFDQTVAHSIDPDLCVAMGAAIQGGLITGDSVGQILLDVTAHSLGLKQWIWWTRKPAMRITSPLSSEETRESPSAGPRFTGRWTMGRTALKWRYSRAKAARVRRTHPWGASFTR